MKTLTKIFTILITSFSFNEANAQFNNNTWLWGTYNNLDYPWGNSTLNFTNNSFAIANDTNVNLNIRGAYSGLTTPDGQYFIYTNGYTICNKNHDTISNGAGLTPGGNDSIYRLMGIPVPFNAILLPYPGSDRLMVMISSDNHSHNGYHAENVFYSLIDPSGDNGRGIVLVKNQILITDTFSNGGFTVVRHANGRDWWLLIKRFHLNDFARILITSSGPTFEGFINTPGPIADQGGQGAFSPDGRFLAYFSNLFQLRIYDFDRCTGLISNMLYKTITHDLAGAVTFSPNNRFLYINNVDSLWQFDMDSPDILNSQTFIAKLDTSLHDPVTGWVSGWSCMFAAANGKIYLQNWSGVMLNVINNPDMPGMACNFVQNQVQCPTYYFCTVPTTVNLNLFQEPGSPCDTLGVGLQEEKDVGLKLKIAPNPSNGRFYIEYKAQIQIGLLYMYDVNGNEVFKEYISPDTTVHEVDVRGKAAAGMYAFALVFGQLREVRTVVVDY